MSYTCMIVYFFGYLKVEVIDVFNVWENEHRPLWKSYLEEASDYVIEQTGLTKEQLKDVLQVMYEHRIIN